MADTLKNRKFYIACTAADGPSPDPQDTDLADAAAYAALDWTQVKHVGSIGETGTKDNIVSYDEMDTDVVQKQKGISNAGDPPIEVARVGSDNGQKAMRAAGLTKNSYAFKVVDDDMPSGGTTPTIYYMRGLVGGPTRPNGRQENFNLEVYTLGLKQREIIVDAA